MLEIETTNLTPEIVLQTSGHVEKFKDLMCRDLQTNNCFRADHLLEEKIEELLKQTTDATRQAHLIDIKTHAGDYPQEKLAELLKQFDVRAPDTNNALSEPFPFNLMFETQIGPSGQQRGFLRPETAQGIFVNFNRLLEFNGGKLPFAAATIGYAFRNEISPRAGLLRVREFTLAEIEHFVAPHNKQHGKFSAVEKIEVDLYPRDQQEGDKNQLRITIGQAVRDQMINNETLGYYIARVYLFLRASGIRQGGIRFRQHMSNEMAHYASDCWDAELLTSYGWVECVGIADRSCYDLSCHSRRSGARLSAYEAFAQPREEDVTEIKINKGAIGKTFGKQAQSIITKLSQLDHDQIQQFKASSCSSSTGDYKLALDSGDEVNLSATMIDFIQKKIKVSGRNFIPAVIEPSFGIGRIMYAILEQSFSVREKDARRGVLSLTAVVAPVKCSILPLTQAAVLQPFVSQIVQLLTHAGISHKVDDVGQSIGRRYARTDEIGIPFGITIDFDTVKDQTITIRERDSMKQIRTPIDRLVSVIERTLNGEDWQIVSSEWPVFESKEEEEN